MSVVYKPLGARVLVEDIITELDLTARGAKVGIQVITDERNQPKPTTGRVLAMGKDPMLLEAEIEIGSVVQFDRLAGTWVYLQGVRYRSLELQEIIGVEPKEKV